MMNQPPEGSQHTQPPSTFHQVPGQFAPPQGNIPPPPPRVKSSRLAWIIGIILAILVIPAAWQSLPQNRPATPIVQPATQAAQPTKEPTKEVSHYPPKTKADLLALAAKGNPKNIHEVSYQKAGAAASCPIPRVTVTVDRSLTGQALAQDLLAYFYGNHLDSPCSAIVFAMHDKSETGVFSAGRIKLDVTTASGDINTDPYASGLKYELTLNVGKFGEGQEYVVRYEG